MPSGAKRDRVKSNHEPAPEGPRNAGLVEERLRESDLMFRSIVENSHAGIFVTDNNYHFSYVNDMMSELFGYRRDELIGLDFRVLLDEASRQLVVDRYARRQRGENVPSRYEFTVVRKDGRKRRMELSSTVTINTRGIPQTVGQLLDVTERTNAEDALRSAQEELENRVEQRTADLVAANALLKGEIAQRELAEKDLRESETKYRHLVESANTIILEMDLDGRTIFLNRFAEGFFGFSEAEILGKSVVRTIVPGTDTAGKDLQVMIDDIVTHPERYLHNDNENIRRNGERVWIVWTNQPLCDEKGRLKEILCVGIDRTEQKKGEEMLAQQLRERTAAEERSRIARDLHDAVSQTLFSTSMIAEVLPRLWDKNPDDGRKRLEEIRQLTRGALAEMRTLVFELRPAALVDAELGALLHQLAESVSGRARVPVTVDIVGQCETPAEVKVALYRITQEALNNVAKHAAASHAKVTLYCEPSGITLSVTDNGSGFDVTHRRPDSLGLGIIRERARAIGASLSVNSRPGQGTNIVVEWKNDSEGAKYG